MASRDPLTANFLALLDQAGSVVVQLRTATAQAAFALVGLDSHAEADALHAAREVGRDAWADRTNMNLSLRHLTAARAAATEEAVAWRSAVLTSLRVLALDDPHGAAVVRDALGDRAPWPARAAQVTRAALDRLAARPRLLARDAVITPLLTEGEAVYTKLAELEVRREAAAELNFNAGQARDAAAAHLRELLRSTRRWWALAKTRDPRLFPLDLREAAGAVANRNRRVRRGAATVEAATPTPVDPPPPLPPCDPPADASEPRVVEVRLDG